MNDTSEYEFNRSEIDESSIIVSSSFGSGETLENGELFIQSKDSYLYVDAPIDSNRDVSGSSEVVEYTIKDGESIASIASRFNVTRETIYWANNFDTSHIIHPGDTIKIPPVSGVVHQVKSGQTLSEIAAKYDIDEETIMRQNLLVSASELKAGSTIIIPGAKKIEPKPVEKIVAKNTSSSSKTGKKTSAGYSSA